MSKKYFFIQRTGELYPEWEEKLLGEVAEVLRGNGLSKSSLSAEGTRECILYGELFTKYMTVINNVLSRTSEVSSISSKTGDILMPTSDVTPDGLAKASVIFKEDVLLGSDMNIIRVKTNVNPLFMGYQINHKKEEIIKRVSGSSVKHIYPRNLLDIPYIFPSLAEQEKIAEFFSALDERIALTADKIKLLKEQKQGYMQRVFAQKMVFTDENGDRYPEWEQKKLGEVSASLDNKRVPLSSQERNSLKGNIPYYGATQVVDYINDFIFDEELVLIGEDGVDFESFSTKPIAQFVSGKSWVNNHAHVFRANTGMILSKFLFYSVVHKDVTKYVVGGGRAKLNKSEALKIEILLPSLPEQEKIAGFFSALDEQIELTENKLRLLEEQKKGYLQGIFG